MGSIHYLNTDLAIATADDPTRLVAALEVGGMYQLGSPNLRDDGLWHAIFESNELCDNPETHFRAILTTIESLMPNERQAWDACITRVFDIGYECGVKPWDFNQLVSNSTLRRLVDIGASLRVTLYPAGWPKEALTVGKPKQSRRRRRQ